MSLKEIPGHLLNLILIILKFIIVIKSSTKVVFNQHSHEYIMLIKLMEVRNIQISIKNIVFKNYFSLPS